jgi:hypothetical protein
VGERATALIIIALAFGVLFSALYASAQLYAPRHPPNQIPTEPKISQLQAIETVEQHLAREITNFKEARLYFYQYNFSDSLYESGDSDYSDYIHSINREGGWSFSLVKNNPELLQLPLFFVHANGTQYQINSTDHSFQMRCLKAPDPTYCGLSSVYAANAARDRLVYRTETRWQPSTVDVPYNEGFHLIDAETGELVWNSVEYEKQRMRLAPAPNIDYEGHKTKADKLNELLNPPEVVRVRIAEGASLALSDSPEQQSSKRFFIPKEARAVETISNRVIWTNTDMVAHTVVSDNGYSNPYTSSFNSDFIEPNGTYEYTFVEVGEYPYHCEIHPWMWGKVVVVENFA